MRNRIIVQQNTRQRILIKRQVIRHRLNLKPIRYKLNLKPVRHRLKPVRYRLNPRPFRLRILRFRRPKLQGYRPVWTGTFEAFTKNEVRKNLWRFQHLNMEFEDILSEAYLKFLKCRKDYSYLDTPKHFMALYKTALHNKFYDLAMESTYHKDLCHVEDMYHVDDSDERVHILDKEYSEPFGSDLGLLIGKAPQEIKDVLKAVFEAPVEMSDTSKKPRKQYSNVELSEKVGYSFDFRRKFTDYFLRGEV